MTRLRAVLCDDQEMVLEALSLSLEVLGVSVVASTPEPEAALGLVHLYQPDVCVLDAHFRDASGPEVAARMRAQTPGTAIVMLTADADFSVWAAFDAKILGGVVNKSVDCHSLGAAVRALQRGERVVTGWDRMPRQRAATIEGETLTERENEVLQALVRGASTSDIALDLDISLHTVRTHVQSVMRKLNVSTRAKATQVAVARGLVGSR
ncbi:MAG: two component transcriptional regulator, LuxR family [Marmoricola sp.]|nr:two component transcriptional regulator, LuxR family [Marmoricola sp.]